MRTIRQKQGIPNQRFVILYLIVLVFLIANPIEVCGKTSLRSVYESSETTPTTSSEPEPGSGTAEAPFFFKESSAQVLTGQQTAQHTAAVTPTIMSTITTTTSPLVVELNSGTGIDGVLPSSHRHNHLASNNEQQYHHLSHQEQQHARLDDLAHSLTDLPHSSDNPHNKHHYINTNRQLRSKSKVDIAKVWGVCVCVCVCVCARTYMCVLFVSYFIALRFVLF
jgi:hypothetical protein